ncbi:branched-chain amino acid ABC transporter permease [Candidatus Aerophobetes bacterium]|nr:branched-chain amino acid ABC transporter permease [Candidatus Aerophobetes bacterium]
MGKGNLSGFLILTAFILIAPLLVRNPYYIGILVFWGIYTLITIGLSLLIGYTGQISLGHAAFFGLGAYTSGILSTHFKLSPWLGLIAAVFIAAFVAFIIGAPALKLRGHYLAMATLAFGEIIYIVFNQWISLTGGPSGFGGIPRFCLGGFCLESDFTYYYFVWAIVLLAFLASLNLIHSRVGRALRSIHGSEIAANCMGVDTSGYKLKVFVLSGALGGLAGSLYAHFVTFLSPGTFSVMFSVVLLTMVAVGGMRNIWGAITGTAILTILPEYLRVFQDYDILIYGGVLLLIMIFLPEGLVMGIFNLIKKSLKKAR